LKKSTSLLLSGILVSGMVLGTIVTPATVHAADNATAVTEASSDVINNVTYSDKSGKTIESKSLSGKTGSQITYVPDGYTMADGERPVMGEDFVNVGIKVTNMISAKVNFVDQNNKLVESETINGGDGNIYTLSTLPAGCSWINSSDDTITLESGKEYNIPVSRKVSNTIIFKTADSTEVGRTQIFGDKVGDSVSLTSAQIPSGYAYDGSALTLQSDDNTQFVTVKKSATGTTPFKSVATVKKGVSASLYDINGKQFTTRKLGENSAWKTANEMTLDSVTYYQVSTDEWVRADDVTTTDPDTATDTDTNTNTDVQKADRSIVTAKDGAIIYLYTKDGKKIADRGLKGNTPWATDLMITVNGVKMYRVSTSEWLRVSDIK